MSKVTCRFSVIAPFLAIVLFTTGSLSVANAVAASPAVATGALYDGILPDLRDGIVAATAGELGTYELDVRLGVAASSLSGRERVTFVNATDGSIDEVYFRLFPNAAYYEEGGVTVSDL